MCNSNLKVSNALFWPPWAPGVHAYDADTPVNKTSIHVKLKLKYHNKCQIQARQNGQSKCDNVKNTDQVECGSTCLKS